MPYSGLEWVLSLPNTGSHLTGLPISLPKNCCVLLFVCDNLGGDDFINSNLC